MATNQKLIYVYDAFSSDTDNWEKLATKYGLSRGQIEAMRPAFSACY